MAFWPSAALTGRYLSQVHATFGFCAVGFLASVWLLGSVWRRYYPEVGVIPVAVCAAALGLANGIPFLLSRAEVYEVSISCGFMFVLFSLCAVWRALHASERQACWWAAAASLAYGMAIGARPVLTPGAAILLIPAIRARAGNPGPSGRF